MLLYLSIFQLYQIDKHSSYPHMTSTRAGSKTYLTPDQATYHYPWGNWAGQPVPAHHGIGKLQIEGASHKCHVSCIMMKSVIKIWVHRYSKVRSLSTMFNIVEFLLTFILVLIGVFFLYQGAPKQYMKAVVLFDNQHRSIFHPISSKYWKLKIAVLYCVCFKSVGTFHIAIWIVIILITTK